MKPAFIVSFAAAVLLHALLLFGFRLGTPARQLPTTDDASPVDVDLVAAAPEVPAVAPPTPPEPAPPTPTPPIPARPPEMITPALEPTPKPAATPAPPPPKPRAVVQQPAKKPAPHAPGPPAPAADGTTGAAVTGHARYRSNPKPAYPSEARSQRQEGVVLLSVQVGPDGRVQGITLKRSSGFPLLDQAAISGVKIWTFEPARIAGVAVASRVDVPVRFALSGR